VFGFEEISRFVDDGGRKASPRCTSVTSADLDLGRDAGYWAEKGRPEQLILIWVDDVDAQYDRSAGIDVGLRRTSPTACACSTSPIGGLRLGFMQPTGKGYEQSEGGLTEVPAQS
jgi:hypothetical protein